MIALDTNILIRYLTQDDPIQSPRANAIIAKLSEASPAFISLVTMAETVWVLERSYGVAGPELANIVTGLLQSRALVIENEREVFIAAEALRSARADFSDALIGALGDRAGCSTTLTFDRKAARLPTFSLV